MRRAKYVVGAHPRTLPLLVRLTPEGAERAVGAHTDLVVEGFPRSGNTYAVFALRHANPGLVVASHVHHVGQLHQALALAKPVVVLVREPVACLSSYLLAGPHGRAAGVLKEYVSYHRTVLDLATRHGSAVAVVTFEEATSDMAAVTAAINHRFDLDLRPFSNREADVAEVFARIDAKHTAFQGVSEWTNGVARPAAERAEQLAVQSARLEAPARSSLLSTARVVHQALVDLAIA